MVEYKYQKKGGWKDDKLRKTTKILSENKGENLYTVVRILCVDEDVIDYYDLIWELIMKVRSAQRYEQLRGKNLIDWR